MMRFISMQASESAEQAAVKEWWDSQYPREHMLLFAIPNGGLRNKITAARLKKEGVVAGVADMFLAIPGGQWHYHGLFIEMKKAHGGRQAETQKEFQKAVQGQGYKYVLAHGAGEAIAAIKEYLGVG